MLRTLTALLSLLALPLAQAQTFTAATDPARAQVTLPAPARPELPSILLIGDSTVRNGHDDGQGKGAEGQWGWGNPIAAYLDASRVNLVNRAVGGLSSRTYRSSGHWERSKAFIKKGDWVLMQFGHNDASPVNDNSRARGVLRGTGPEKEDINNLLTGQPETVYTYGAYLRGYIAEIRALGATPVICSPVIRKRWEADGVKVQRAGGNFAAWAAEVARQEGVAFIDLNEWGALRYEALGKETVEKLFPADTPQETVHTNWLGAAVNAQLVIAGLIQNKLLPDAFYTHRFAPDGSDDRPVVDARKVKVEAPRDPRLPSLVLIGDSTVRSGGQNGAYGWGERLAAFFDTQRINVVNNAIGGRSSRTFFTEGRWASVLEQLKAGDILLIQFGHNDGARIGDPAAKNRGSVPGIGPEAVEDTKPDGSKEMVQSFGWYLARYISDAKARGANVVILSPIPHKDRWQAGQPRDFENYAAWGEQVARANGAQFIDLTMLVTEAYRGIGAERVDGFFSDARTHTNDAGAVFNATRVVEGLKRLPGQPLKAYLREPPP
ncbi:lysophospholipase L1-like esterase [Pelomonas saccharophila]|uniref:Lysophospholipase L1-like esterase n=1 Tax=Roseateles saccharophilus TaxID=304 RepID=A0ABU1YJD6_ROSSA|nr:rhamnogalacturonan acetylesterase [Roseateles saccharophilus]MDR7268973.1 lysophospholipase L1-like esterase [Roseateles saccharophilus]